jgi:hypothetical protein
MAARIARHARGVGVVCAAVVAAVAGTAIAGPIAIASPDSETCESGTGTRRQAMPRVRPLLGGSFAGPKVTAARGPKVRHAMGMVTRLLKGRPTPWTVGEMGDRNQHRTEGTRDARAESTALPRAVRGHTHPNLIPVEPPAPRRAGGVEV